jgi:hypothetical protein
MQIVHSLKQFASSCIARHNHTCHPISGAVARAVSIMAQQIFSSSMNAVEELALISKKLSTLMRRKSWGTFPLKWPGWHSLQDLVANNKHFACHNPILLRHVAENQKEYRDNAFLLTHRFLVHYQGAWTWDSSSADQSEHKWVWKGEDIWVHLHPSFEKNRNGD